MKWIRNKDDEFERELQEKIELVRKDYQEKMQEKLDRLELALQEGDPLEEAETFLQEVKRRYRKPVKAKNLSPTIENKVKEITEELENLHHKHNFPEKRLYEDGSLERWNDFQWVLNGFMHNL